MAEQDIYKLVEELNKNKSISDNTKIDSIYGLLDQVKKESEEKTRKPNLQFGEEPKPEETVTASVKRPTTLSDFKDDVKPIRKPSFPTAIRPFEKRSDCFLNILQAIDYGDNNRDYLDGYKTALEKYYGIAQSNPKDFYVVEGRVNDEVAKFRIGMSPDNFTRGYRDGLEYIVKALDKSKELMAKKVNEELLKELG